MVAHVEARAGIIAEAFKGQLLAQLGRDRVELELDLAERAYHLQVRPDSPFAVELVLAHARVVEVADELQQLCNGPL